MNVSQNYTAAFFNSAYTGKVGLNQPTPTAELHVNGTVKITQILHLEPLTALPATGTEGDICVSRDPVTSETKLYIWDNVSSDWVTVGP